MRGWRREVCFSWKNKIPCLSSLKIGPDVFTVIAECQELCPTGQFRFVKANDLTLLKDVDRVCEMIKRMEEEEMRKEERGRSQELIYLLWRMLILLLRNGNVCFFVLDWVGRWMAADGWIETTEGLDALLSLLYYSRMRFIISLIPLLLFLSWALPTGAHVVSVFGPGREISSSPPI